MIDISRIAPALTFGSDGIWHGPATGPVSYPPDGNQDCFSLEDSSFWFSHRNACIVASVAAFPPSKTEPFFDIGGGNGFVSIALMRAGLEVVLVEPGPEGAANAKKRGVPTVICGSVMDAGFTKGALGTVGLFDVIEHTPKDVEFLLGIRSVMKPGGRVYATVPSFAALWSQEDVDAGHFRRYTCQEIEESFRRAGFSVDYATYFFRPLPIAIFLKRSLPFRLGIRGELGKDQAAKDHRPAGGIGSRILTWLLSGEASNVSAKIRMTFGSSCLVVASAS